MVRSPTIAALAVLLIVPSVAGAKPRRADLSLTTLVPAPASIRPATPLTISATVRNRGRRKAGASVLRAYLGAGKARAKGDLLLLGKVRVGVIKPRRTKKVKGSVMVPSTARPGTYRLLVCADDGKAVRETSERNNCRASALTTMVVPAAGGSVPGPSPIAVPTAPPDEPPPVPSSTPGPTPTTSGPTPTPTATATATATATPPTSDLPGGDKPVPPPPAPPVAPPLSAVQPTSFADGTDFLYTGPDPVQTGVASDTIDPARAGVLSGRVLDAGGQGLPSVTVTVADHPELGQTVSRSDGKYDLAVNAGGTLTLHFERPTYLPVERMVIPRERDYDPLEDVVMRQFDAKVAEVVPEAVGGQVAQSSTTTDGDGSRQANLLFAPGTHATMRLKDGTTQPLTTLHVRTTEFTVGNRGPDAMPGTLPPRSAYTYAAEYSVDEAVEAGATRVDFDKPVVVYTTNFLGFAVGTAVPLGSYDQAANAWETEQNGRVIKVLAVSDGKAAIDADGDGDADSAGELAALGITDLERQQLAGLYTPGATVWRASVTHFTPWDHNWPYGPPNGSGPPPGGPNGGGGGGGGPGPRKPKDPRKPCKKPGGSEVDCDARALRESLPVAGTPFTLNYTSDRARIHDANDVDIVVTGPSVPGPVKRAELVVEVAGTSKAYTFASPGPNLTQKYHWDGKDGFGRTVHGLQDGQATITYVYDAVYRTAAQNADAFGRFGNAITAVRAREEIRIETVVPISVGRPATPPDALGGWTLDVSHQLDRTSGSVQLGTGTTMAAPVKDVAHVLYDDDEDLAQLSYGSRTHVRSATAQPDGSAWFGVELYNYSEGTGTFEVRRRAPDGTVTKVGKLPVLNGGQYIYASMAAAPDGGAWILAAVGPHNESNGPIWHMAPDGTVTKVTKGEQNAYVEPTNDGDGQPAEDVYLNYPNQLVSGYDGTLYIREQGPGVRRIQHIRADGTLETVYNLPSLNLGVDSLAVAPDGTLVMSISSNQGGTDPQIARLTPGGVLQTIVGGGQAACCSNGQAARSVGYNSYGPVAVDADGLVYFYASGKLFKVGPGEKLVQIAGNGTYDTDPDADGHGALTTPVPVSGVLQVDANGRVLATSDANVNPTLHAIEPGIPGFASGQISVPSQTGSEVYLFDGDGRQISTVDPLEGRTLTSFDYDAAGRLAKVTDRDGLTTAIERDGNGTAKAIVAPNGERTELTVNGNGDLTGIGRPGGLTTQLTYGGGGLLSSETDYAGGVHQFAYDADGYVTKDTDPDGVALQLVYSESADGTLKTTVTEPAGEASSYTNGGNAETGWSRTVTEPSGATTVTNDAPNGSRTATLEDGRTFSGSRRDDPRFGGLATFFGSQTSTAPSGLAFDLKRTRTTTLSNPANVFSVTSSTDTVTSNATGLHHTSTYDGATNTTTAKDSADRASSATLDARDRVTSVTPNAQTAITTTYDTRGRPTRLAQGVRELLYAYNPLDRLTSMTDALGHETQFGYDTGGRVTSTRLPGNETYAFAHDGMDRLTQVTAPSGAVSTLGYTPAGRPRKFVPPGSGSGYVTARDADGRKKTFTLPGGRVVTYGRGGDGRVTSMTYPEASVGVGYDHLDGRVGSVSRTPSGGSDASGLTFGYDGELMTSMAWTGASVGSYALAYDANHEVAQAKITVGGNTQTTNVTRDPEGRVTADGPFTVSRNGPGGAISKIAGGALVLTQGWDNQARLSARTDAVGGTTEYSSQLTRDAVGRITKKVESVGGTSHTYDYTYDADDQLTDVSRDNGPFEHYAYDADGNRTSRTVDGVTRAATYSAAGKLTGLGGSAVSVNDDGFETARGSDTFTWSARGELLSATVGGTTQGYAYDGDGRLVARTTAGQTWRYFYGNPDQQLQVTAALEPDGTLDTLSYTDTGYLYSILKGGTRYTVSTDQVGTPRVVTSESQTKVKVVDVSAYGETLSDSAPAFELPVGYGGGIADPVTRLVFMGVRPYDPTAGRFMARDPLGFAGGTVNLYQYGNNDPITFSDPAGFVGVGLSVCDGVCVGTRFSFTKDGFSACVEAGVGYKSNGITPTISPEAGLEGNKVYAKASATGSFGPLGSLEAGDELSHDGDCFNNKPFGKACVVGVCLDDKGKPSFNPKKPLDAAAPDLDPKLGFGAKAVVGVCQTVP